MKWSIFLLVALIALMVQAQLSSKRVLVLSETGDIKSTHSIFFKSLKESGYDLDFATGGERGISLRKYGEWQYDNLVIFAPSLEESDSISEQDVVDFIDAGRNVLIAADKNIGSLIANVASECNVEFDEADTSVIDHFNFDATDYDGKHDLLVVDNVVDASIIFPTKIDAPILYRGVASDIDEDSSLLFPILTGYATSYSASDSPLTDDNLYVAGRKAVLVAALQARNNARVIFSGSLDLFSDKFFNSAVKRSGAAQAFPKSGNENFAKQLASWTFQERGILRVKSISHHQVGETEAPAVYTIKEDIQYTIEVEELKGNAWVPFVANDVQLEFIMLDPYLRITLKSDGKGKFSSTFKIPDVYGIFTFKVDYHRKGYGYIDAIVRVPVRPFRHNQYERFIPAAFPYYASALSMMAGLFIFSWFFLYSKPK